MLEMRPFDAFLRIQNFVVRNWKGSRFRDLGFERFEFVRFVIFGTRFEMFGIFLNKMVRNFEARNFKGSRFW